MSDDTINVFLVTSSFSLAAESCPIVLTALQANDIDALAELVPQIAAVAKTARLAFAALPPPWRAHLASAGVTDVTIGQIEHIANMARGRVESQLEKQKTAALAVH